MLPHIRQDTPLATSAIAFSSMADMPPPSSLRREVKILESYIYILYIYWCI
jgi:hypothetical protein